MYNYKIKFIEKTETVEVDGDTIFEAIDWYLNALSNNGQVVEGYSIFWDDNYYYASVILPEEDSLSDANNGYYVKKTLEKVKEYFDVELLCEGVNAEHDEVCKCEKPSWYMLYVRPESADYPLICGDCDSPVPLYKIPHLSNDKEHYSLRHWSHMYKAVFDLWIAGFNDRYTYKQQNLHSSQLSREGLKVCKELKKLLDVPVYYYLFYFDYIDDTLLAPKGLKEPPKLCPKCGYDWTCPTQINPMHHKCEKCGLLTDNPDWEREEK